MLLALRDHEFAESDDGVRPDLRDHELRPVDATEVGDIVYHGP